MADTSSSLFYDIASSKSDQTTSTTSTSKSSGSSLDKDAFLRLLVTQLQYQDPLDPMDNTEFVAQMAQFTALEQMQNLNSTMSNSQAYSMIGRTVYAQVYNESTNKYEDIAGTVSSVTIKSGTPYLNVGDKEVPFSDVQQVYSTDTNTSIDKNLVVSQALSLVGKTIQAITFDENSNPIDFVEGKVGYVKFVGETPVLSVDGKDVYVSEVLSVSDNTLLKGQKLSAEVFDSTSNKDINVSGTVSDITIDNEKLYVTVDGKKVEIKDISSVLKAISYVGKDVSYTDKDSKETISGTVDGVFIKDTESYLTIGDEMVALSKIEG